MLKKITNTTLSQPQISTLYNEGMGGTLLNGQQLLIRFQLNNFFRDFSVNANNAVLASGKITFTTDYPAP